MGTWADEATREDAELLLTELVANGVLHARSSMEINLTVERHRLRAEVRDASPLALLAREADDYGGRGVLILDALASSWGVVGHSGAGKTVWFELAHSAALARV
jgi:serine/threonine-protein kinase RsbW